MLAVALRRVGGLRFECVPMPMSPRAFLLLCVASSAMRCCRFWCTNQPSPCAAVAQGYSTTDGSPVWAFFPCHPDDPDPGHRNEAWAVNPNGTITEIMTGKCLDTERSGFIAATNPIVIRACNGKATQQVPCVVQCRGRGCLWVVHVHPSRGSHECWHACVPCACEANVCGYCARGLWPHCVRVCRVCAWSLCVCVHQTPLVRPCVYMSACLCECLGLVCDGDCCV